jgi:Mn-dependent DtxR family transcriptional regulator
LKQKVFDLVASSQKRLKPGDLAKPLARSLGIDKREVHEAIRELTSEGRLIYTYAGHSWLELPADSQ